MIEKKENYTSVNKPIKILLSGVPGSGKTTLALSSKNPLLIDIDKGVDRVEVRYRSDVDRVATYDELVSDLQSEAIKQYDTIVVDTGGKLMEEIIKPKVIKDNPKNGQSDGTLALKGYGVAYKIWQNLVRLISSLGKDQIWVFHTTENQVKVGGDDVVAYRLQIEGKARQEFWNDVDLGGFLEIVGEKRILHFKQCERYFAKGNHGITGDYEVPILDKNSKNDFMSKLINKYRENINAEENAEKKDNNIYGETMKKGKSIIESENDLNKALSEIASLNHVSTTKQELFAKLNQKAKEKGFIYDKTSKAFTNNSKSA